MTEEETQDLTLERIHRAQDKAWRFGVTYSILLGGYVGVVLVYLILYRFNPTATCAITAYFVTEGVAGDGKADIVNQCLELNQKTLQYIAVGLVGTIGISYLVNLVILRRAHVELEGAGGKVVIGGDDAP